MAPRLPAPTTPWAGTLKIIAVRPLTHNCLSQRCLALALDPLYPFPTELSNCPFAVLAILFASCSYEYQTYNSTVLAQ